MVGHCDPPPKEFLRPFQKGVATNPAGKPKGTKNARTIVREFMDRKIDSIDGTKVSRFQYLLWSMYEMSFRLHKQVEYRLTEIKQAEVYLKVAKDAFLKFTIPIKNPSAFAAAGDKLAVRERELRSRNKDYEKLILQVQEADKNLSDFFQKASGQYLEKKEIENINTQPLHVTADEEDIQKAIGLINEEIG